MTKKRMLALGGTIVLVLLMAGSGLGAYVYAQDGEVGADDGAEVEKVGAIDCGDSVSCTNTDQVVSVTNIDKTAGHGIKAQTSSITQSKAAVFGYADRRARGVFGKSKKGPGVYGKSIDGYGGYFDSDGSSGIYVAPAAVHGVHVESANLCGFRVDGALVSGLWVDNALLSGIYVNDCLSYAAWLKGEAGAAILADSGNIIEGYDAEPSQELMFKVDNAGEVTAKGSFTGGGADFADMSPAVSGLEPADVLVIGPDGKLARSSEACSTAVAGVYSTKPGFIGGHGMDEDTTGKVPLAIVGIVPVKASAENGPICPGDLLTTSGTPGHAMKAIDPANGTIIGKAMESLESGTGTIKMLVTLQ